MFASLSLSLPLSFLSSELQTITTHRFEGKTVEKSSKQATPPTNLPEMEKFRCSIPLSRYSISCAIL